jgi:iron complex outermembrane recepter protein
MRPFYGMANMISSPRWLRVAGLLALVAGAPCRGWSIGPNETLPPPGTLKTLTIDQLLDLDVTSVSRRPERLFTTASAIQVVTGEDVRRSGATSLPEALRLATNLEVAQIDSRQWAITARGFNNVFADKMLVMIDGRSVYTPLYAGVYWDVQDTLLADLDRIEVISGPGGTLWGANAMNGVINITTKSAKDTQGGLIDAGVGGELRHSVAIRYGGRTAKGVYYRAYAKQFDRGDSVRSNGRDSNDAWRMVQAGFRADYDANANDTLTLQGDAYNGSVGQVGPDNIRVNGVNLLSRWSRVFTATSDLKLQLYFDRTHRRIPGSFTQDINTYDLDFQHRFPVGARNDIVWGFGSRAAADSIENTPANAFLPAHVVHDWFSFFGQDELSLVRDRLALTAGTKVEHNDYTGFEVEPNLRLTFTPNRQHTLWTAVSRAVRTPSRVDRDLYSPAAPPFRVAGGTNVVSEKVIASEAGYRTQFGPELMVSVATFFNRYRDLRSLDPLNPPFAFPVEASSDLEGWSAGAEVTAEWRVAPAWRLRGGYTEMRVHSEAEPHSGARGTRDAIARDPNHQFRLRSQWDISSAWECDGTLRYASPIGSQNLPGYTELDLRIGWSRNERWEISLVGQNLLHAHHPEFNGIGSRREIQRGVYAKASCRF